MAVKCLRSVSLEELLSTRIDFTSGGKHNPEDIVLPERCKVLQSDKIHYGDKSTTGSPLSSLRGSGQRESSSSSSSGSSACSPLSYTQDLIGVDSPGLSGGAGGTTQKDQQQLSPLISNKYPGASSNGGEVPHVRRSRFDIPPDGVATDGKQPISVAPPKPTLAAPSLVKDEKSPIKPQPTLNGVTENGHLPKSPLVGPVKKEPQSGERVNGNKRKASSSEGSDDDEDEVDSSKLNVGMGAFMKRLKMESSSSSSTASTTVKQTPTAVPPPVASPPPKKIHPAAFPLLPRVLVAQKTATSPVNDVPVFGPQLPTQNGQNGYVKSPSSPYVNGKASSPAVTPSSSKESLLPRSPATPTSTTKTGTSASSLQGASNRKRLLSERGEQELTYPVMESHIVSKWTWADAQWMGTRPRGAGLINRSNDCFLNAILQMITHTAPIARYLVERHHTECRREVHCCVACAMKKHLMSTFKSPSPLGTGWIRPHLAQFFPSHMNGMQEDAHELLALMLDAIDPPVGSSNGGNKELPASKIKPSTPVEQIFGGTLRNQVTCQLCKTPYINYERIRELNLAIVRRNEERVSLTTLVADYFKNETLQAFSCKKCARKTQAVRETRILRAPSVLLVQLKRFNAYGGKIRQPVIPDRDLNLSNWTFAGGLSTDGSKVTSHYRLTSVVEHLGGAVDHGHYISYVQGTDGTAWYKFDDDEVQKIPPHEVQNGPNPYLLVYTKVEGGAGRGGGEVPVKNGMINGHYKPNGNGYMNNVRRSYPSAGAPSTLYGKNHGTPYANGNRSKLIYNGNANRYGNGQGGYGQNRQVSQFKWRAQQNI